MAQFLAPTWLDETAKDYWRKHAPHLSEAGLLTAVSKETFAMLCQVYSDYRKAADLREKKVNLELYLKFAKELGFLKQTRTDARKQPDLDEIDALMT